MTSQKPIPVRKNMSALPARAGLDRPISAADAEGERDRLSFEPRGRRGMEEVDLPDPRQGVAGTGAEAADDESLIERAAADDYIRDNPHDAPIFTRGPARRPQPVVADALLQWATGLPTDDRRVYAGWLVEAGKRTDLDAAMARAGFGQVTIRHGGGNLVTHWAVETANLFVVAEGVQSLAELRQTRERYGVAFAWRTRQDGRGESALRCRVLLRELLTVGFTEPLLLSVKSTLTGDVIGALTRQYELLDAANELRRMQGKPPQDLPFYACAIPLGPGQEVARGGVQTKAITPPVARIPEAITRAWLAAQWIRREWTPAIEDLLDATVAWSAAESARIAAGGEEAEPPL